MSKSPHKYNHNITQTIISEAKKFVGVAANVASDKKVKRIQKLVRYMSKTV